MQPAILTACAAALIAMNAAAPILRAQPADSLKTYRVPEVLVEAFRTPLGLDSVPYGVTIANARPDGQGLGLDELLAGAPGVQVENRFNLAVGDRIVMRGFGARTQFGVRGVHVIADGIPATFADGQSALEVIDPDEIGRAEIIRGPASALYGNASGGVILLRESPPWPGPVEVAASMTAGAYGLLRTGARVGGTSDGLSYRIDLSRFAYDGYRRHSAAGARRAGAEVNYGMSGDDTIRLNAGFVDFDAQNPGSLSDSILKLDPRQAFATNVKQGTGKNGSQGQIGLTWSHRFSWSALELNAHGIRRDIVNPIAATIVDLNRAAGGAGALLHGTLSAGAIPVDWMAGADLDLLFDDRRNYLNVGGERGAVALDQAERVVGAGTFVQLMARAGESIRVMGSLRYDRTMFSVTDRLIDSADPDDSGRRAMWALSPSAGILWSIAPAASLYANVATAFETPTTTELANRPSGAGGFSADLQPQRALSFEFGARGRAGTLLSYQFALYNIHIIDELIPFQVPGDPDRDYFRNAGSAVHRGIEAAVTLTPFDALRAHAAASWIDARYDHYAVNGTVFDGNRVPGIEPLRLDAAITFTAGAGWYLGADARFVARTVTNDANSASAPTYTLVGLRGGYAGIVIGAASSPWSYSIAPFIGVSNVLDAHYNASITVNAFGGRYFEPGAGRAIYGGVEIGVGRERR